MLTLMELMCPEKAGQIIWQKKSSGRLDLWSNDWISFEGF